MLTSSVILVLREVLEAALLISLLMAFSRRLTVSHRWVLVAFVTGILGAAIYGFNIDRVSSLFEGVGQELLNAFLQIMIYVLLCLIAGFALSHLRGAKIRQGAFSVLMTLAVALAVVREGSEIMIYLSGFLTFENQRVPVIVGSTIGAGLGISVGAVFYFLLLNLGHRAARTTGAILLMLVAAGMMSQAALLLIQADWLPAQYPLWDSDWLISEQSVTGQLLYALIGYEATPTALQVGIYLTSLALLMLFAWCLSELRRPKVAAQVQGAGHA